MKYQLAMEGVAPLNIVFKSGGNITEASDQGGVPGFSAEHKAQINCKSIVD